MIVPLLLDRAVTFEQGGPTCNLLDLPVAAGSLGAYLADRLARLEYQDVFVLRASAGSATDRSNGRHERFTQVRPERLSALAHAHETTDQLLVIDPSRWPANGFDTGIFQQSDGYRGATHAVAVGSNLQQQRELIDRDADGRIRRVQRLYNDVNWPEVAGSNAFACIMPIRAVAGLSFHTLPELRAALASAGVLARDLPLPIDVLDLTTHWGLLRLSETLLTAKRHGGTHANLVAREDGVLVSRNSQVHPSARIFGPVVIHEDAIIERGATVVGPSVIGPGTRIEEDAIIVQAVLGPRSHVRRSASVRHSVLLGERSIEHSNDTACFAPAAPRERQSVESDAEFGPGCWSRRAQLAIKRGVDIVVSFVGLLLLSPLMLIVAILIKLESPGPVLFIHHRESRGGREFPCYKFRTMRNDAHRLQRELYKQNEMDGPQFKISNDPRVTMIGRWIRSTNIDELPQLINVLLGHMSLVGPRPSPFRENQICVPWRLARLSVRPGITGLWQICRSRLSGDFHEWIYYDMCYVRSFSMWLDIKIVIATVLGLGGQWRVPLSWIVRTQAGSSSRQRPSKTQLVVPI